MLQAFVGTFSQSGGFGGGGTGVHSFRITGRDGSGVAHAVAPLPDPSFLVVSRRGLVYVGCHVNHFEGRPGGALVALDADGLQRTAVAMIDHPHVTSVSLDPGENHLLAASSFGGGVSVSELADDGSIGALRASITMPGRVLIPLGSAPDPVEVPGLSGMTVPALPMPHISTHPHCAVTDPAGRRVLVTDLAQNTVTAFDFDPATGQLSSPCTMAMGAGDAGPRLVLPHPSLPIAYVVNEINSTVSVLHLEHEFVEMQTVHTTHSRAPSSSAGLAVHPSGEFVYATNRSDGTVACFSVDTSSGHLKLFDVVDSGGRRPHNLALAPDGDLLFVANTASDDVTILRIDRRGRLSSTGAALRVPSPTCIVIAHRSA